jgi:hypothetical protein
LWQSTLEEIDHPGERRLEYSAAQATESFGVARGCVRGWPRCPTLLATAGELATRALDRVRGWTAPSNLAAHQVGTPKGGRPPLDLAALLSSPALDV